MSLKLQFLVSIWCMSVIYRKFIFPKTFTWVKIGWVSYLQLNHTPSLLCTDWNTLLPATWQASTLRSLWSSSYTLESYMVIWTLLVKSWGLRIDNSTRFVHNITEWMFGSFMVDSWTRLGFQVGPLNLEGWVIGLISIIYRTCCAAGYT